MDLISEHYGEAFRRLCVICLTEDNWDGEGAVAPTNETLQTVLDMTHNMRDAGIKRPMLAVGANGSVSLNWKQDRMWLSVTVYETRVVAVATVKGAAVHMSNWEGDKLPENFVEYAMKHYAFQGE